jgi:SAM-dependent methyltransferase
VPCFDFWNRLVSIEGQQTVKEFALACQQNAHLVASLTLQLQARNKSPELTTVQRIRNRYEIEYASREELRGLGYRVADQVLASAQLPLYDSRSPLNELGPFTRLVLRNTTLEGQMPAIRVLDVAAGRGNFAQFVKEELGVPVEQIVCVDLSSTSTARTTELGFPSITGDINNLTTNQVAGPFDLVCLGYFIDRDAQPKITLDYIQKFLPPSPGGVLIFEGLLPVVPIDSRGTAYTQPQDRISPGSDLVDDALAIVRLVEGNTDGLKLVAFALGAKPLRSLDGPELLSSSALVFARRKP